MLEVFSFFKKERPVELSPEESSFRAPSVKLSTDKTAYRPGDTLIATIEVSRDGKFSSSTPTILLENLVIEIKGIEKLDPQWIITAEPPRGSRQRRGERTIMESSPTAIVSDVPFDEGMKKTYLVRTVLPKVLPPSYKGSVVRYLYYLVVTLHWSIAATENGHYNHTNSKATLPQSEVKTLLNIWTMPASSGMTHEEPHAKDNVGGLPKSASQVEIYWKENGDDNDWARASDVVSETEDEVASLSTESALPSPEKGSLGMTFDRVLQLQSPVISQTDQRSSLSMRKPPTLTIPPFPDLDSAEDSHLKNGYIPDGRASFRGKASLEIWANRNHMLPENEANENFGNYEQEVGAFVPRSPSGAYTRGRSYNIRLEDQLLAQFSPRNPDSTYYFGDVVGGVLTFFHDAGSRRCLEISAELETREVLNPAFIHPSRRNSPVITKLQADYFEAVANMLQTHFVFSIPFDGPPSFTIPQVSVQWILRLKFVTTAPNLDITKYEHPLLIGDRQTAEWSIPIIVHAPLPRSQKARVRRERPASPRREPWENLTDSAGRIPPLSLPPNEKFRSNNLASSSFGSLY